ncbi:MAG: hypothetical protein ACRDIY_11110 [Chloroflexota bacterium]
MSLRRVAILIASITKIVMPPSTIVARPASRFLIVALLFAALFEWSLAKLAWRVTEDSFSMCYTGKRYNLSLFLTERSFSSPRGDWP